MTAETIDISGLSAAERVALMERLWRSLAGDPMTAEPPDWHDAVIESRRPEWLERAEVSEEWSKVREELRRDLE
jgi:hypothetical protein